jgi:hypothetical protein
MTRGVPAARGSAGRVSGPHEWPPSKEGVVRNARGRTAVYETHPTMKKNKKNRTALSTIYFSR